MFLLSNLYLYFTVIVRIQHALLPYRINDFDFRFFSYLDSLNAYRQYQTIIGVRTMGTGGYIVPQVQDLYPPVLPKSKIRLMSKF